MEKFSFYCHLVSFVLFSHVIVNGLDYKDLMQKYYLLCGADYFCYHAADTHTFEVSPDYFYNSSTNYSICPKCECDFECARRGDCCPDVFFKFPELRCVNRTIIKGADEHARDQQYSELMVTTCPKGSDETLRQKCERNETISQLQNFPVTALSHFALTFFNKYCAECHGITDVHKWSLDINCDVLADFNYLSDFEEVISLANRQKCIFQTYLPNKNIADSPPENCEYSNIGEDENGTLFTKCNETGLWEHFDPTIQYACESSFRGRYRVFKNVFCYICNPSMHMTYQGISQCNLTGQWERYDLGLERACSEFPSSQATLPYKNIFCYLCNKGNDSNGNFVDVKGNIIEHRINDPDFRLNYEVFINGFNLDHFSFLVKHKIEHAKGLDDYVYAPPSKSTIQTVNGSTINLANIIQQSVALDPRRIGLCPFRQHLLPHQFLTPCLCDPSCLFVHHQNCCADLALELSTTCRDELELSNVAEFRPEHLGFSTIKGCFQEETYEIFRQECTNGQKNNSYSLLPVDLPSRNLSFDNLYCVICNLRSREYAEILNGVKTIGNNNTGNKSVYEVLDDFSEVQHLFLPWSLEIACPQHLDYSHYLHVGDLLKTAHKLKCLVKYNNTNFKSQLCDFKQKVKCSDYTNWTYSDNETEWACSSVMTYPKYFGRFIMDVIDDFDFDLSKTYMKMYKSPAYTNAFLWSVRTNL